MYMEISNKGKRKYKKVTFSLAFPKRFPFLKYFYP